MEIKSPCLYAPCIYLDFGDNLIWFNGVPGFLGNYLKVISGVTRYLGHMRHLNSLDMILVIDHLFSQGLLNLFVDFVHDGGEVIIEFKLKFLVMAPALIRCPSFENLWQSKKDLALTTLLLGEKIIVIAPHEAIVDIVLGGRPSPSWVSLLVHLQAKLFDLVIFRLKALLIWLFFSS